MIDTALPLPQARASRDEHVGCRIDVGPVEDVAAGEWLRVERYGGELTLRFAELARFDVNARRDHVVCHPAPGVSDPTLGHLLLDHVLPRLLAERGFTVLHASAVVTGFGAVGFCGETGAGKSTLAASFATAGAPVLSDDALVLADTPSGLEAHATYPGVRLWPENAVAVAGPGATGAPVAHYTDKRRLGPRDLDARAFAAGRCTLARVFVLEETPEETADTIVIAEMSARDAFLAISRQTFRLDPGDRERSAEIFEQLTRSPLLRICRSLRYPREHARLADVRGAILEELARSSPR